MYAAGWALENELLLPDSAAEMYGLIKQKYPTTIYGRKIFDKVSIYNQEMKRRKILKETKVKLNKKNKFISVEKDSLTLHKRTLQKRNSNMSRFTLLDSLKKLGINLPDSVKRKILLDKRQQYFKKDVIKKDSLFIDK